MHLAAAFVPPALHRHIDEEVFQGPQQKRTEPAAARIGRLEKVSLHDHEEKILGEVLGIGSRIAAAINESKDGSPINLAKLGEPGIDLAGAPSGAESLADETPAGSDEMSERTGTFDGGRSSHASSVNGPYVLLKHKIRNGPVFSVI